MSKYEKLPMNKKPKHTAINYMTTSKGMFKEIDERMQKRKVNDVPYHKVDRHIRGDNNYKCILTHMTSEDFLNRDVAPLRKQMKESTAQIGQKYNPKFQASHLAPIGRIKKDEKHNLIAGNMVRSEDIIEHPEGSQAGDSINITVPQDQHNKTTNMNDARQIWQPYDKEKYIRTGDLLQRGQSVLMSANRLLLTQPFARIYAEHRRKGYDHEAAYKMAINEEIEHHQRKEHELFNPYIEEGLYNLSPPHKKIVEITQKIKDDGEYGKVITNLSKLDPEKLKNIASILSAPVSVSSN